MTGIEKESKGKKKKREEELFGFEVKEDERLFRCGAKWCLFDEKKKYCFAQKKFLHDWMQSI